MAVFFFSFFFSSQIFFFAEKKKKRLGGKEGVGGDKEGRNGFFFSKQSARCKLWGIWVVTQKRQFCQVKNDLPKREHPPSTLVQQPVRTLFSSPSKSVNEKEKKKASLEYSSSEALRY